jgi:hypothetical protein
MRVLRPGALLGAFLIASPNFWAAATTGGSAVDAALLRFLIAIVPCGIALALLDGLIDAYVSGVGRGTSSSDSGSIEGGRRRTDGELGPGV